MASLPELIDYYDRMASSTEDNHSAAWWGNGHVMSPADYQSLKNKSMELSEQRDYDERIWQERQSIPGLVSQYKRAGMNPILATGIQPTAASGAASGSDVGSTSPSGGSDFLGGILDLFGRLFGFSTDIANTVNNAKATSSQVSLNDANAREADERAKNLAADTRNKSLDYQQKEITLKFYEAEKELGLKETQVRIDKSLSDIAMNNSDISVNNSTIEVNGARISLIGSQEDLNKSMKIFNDLRSQEIREILPYVKDAYLQDMVLKSEQANAANAAADASRSQATYTDTMTYFDALSKLGSYLKDKAIIDSGYYEHLTSQVDAYKDALERNASTNELNAEVSKVNAASNVIRNIVSIVLAAAGIATGNPALVGAGFAGSASGSTVSPGGSSAGFPAGMPPAPMN